MTTTNPTTTHLEPVAKLLRDIRLASATLGRDEARFLVDTFYSLQDFRIQAANQVRSIVKDGDEEPHATLSFFSEQFVAMEKQVGQALDTYSKNQPLGIWAREHIGVGPVIAAGLLAHIDVTKTSSASSVHRYAGLVPGQKKTKGVKRDWNADLKVLCWKLGDSFVKQSGNEKCYYGHLYRERKEFEIKRDLKVQEVPESAVTVIEDQPNGTVTLDGELHTAYPIGEKWFINGNARDASTTMVEKNIADPDTKAKYLSGHLPDGRLDMRARRYAVKRFLTHLWEQAWYFEYGTEPPHPYVEVYLGHTDIVGPPIPFVKTKLA